VLERELDRLLTARGWARGADADDMEWFLPLADGLEIGLDVFEDEDGKIAADIDVHHLRAQSWLIARGERISVHLSSEPATASWRRNDPALRLHPAGCSGLAGRPLVRRRARVTSSCRVSRGFSPSPSCWLSGWASRTG
jgi:hypothetical protein